MMKAAESPVSRAWKYQHWAVLRRSRGWVVDKDRLGRSVLFHPMSERHVAFVRRHREEPDVRLMAETVDRHGITPLCWAVRNRLVSVASLLLDLGADVHRSSPLAPNSFTSPLELAILQSDEPMMALLLRHGASVMWQHSERDLNGVVRALSSPVAPAVMEHALRQAMNEVGDDALRIFIVHQADKCAAGPVLQALAWLDEERLRHQVPESVKQDTQNWERL